MTGELFILAASSTAFAVEELVQLNAGIA